MRLEDLYDVQQEIMDELCEENEEHQLDDLISRSLFQITSAAGAIVSAYHSARFKQTKIDEKLIKANLFTITRFTTVLMYCLEIEPMPLEDIQTYASEFVSEVAVDAILSAYSVLRSTSELGLSYYAEDTTEEQSEQYLAEILASVSLLAERIGTSLPNILAKV